MKEHRLSIAGLAAAVRIQQATLRNFREGHRKLPDDVMEAMARELGTSVDYLMDRSDDPRPTEVIREEARRREEMRARQGAADAAAGGSHGSPDNV